LFLIICELIWEMQNSYNLVGSESIQLAPVAVMYSDRSVFYDCGFVSYQNTLFDAMKHHYFKDCYFEGEIDFIYGNDQSYYEVIIPIFLY